MICASKSIGIVIRVNQSNTDCPRCIGGLNAQRGVFDDDALLRGESQLFGGGEEDLRVRFSLRDILMGPLQFLSVTMSCLEAFT